MAARNPTTPTYPIAGKALYGTTRDDVLVTAADTDAVDAREGNDLIIVTNSIGKSLTVVGNLGNDTVSYAGASQGANIDLTNSSWNAGAAQGHVFSSIENLIGSDHSDTFHGTGHANRVVGGGDTDYLFGWGGNDILEGGDALDYLNGGEGHDTLDGGGGDDVINGGAGNDTLIGGPGADAMHGGNASADAGIDTVSYANYPFHVTLSLANGMGTSGHAAGDTYVGIENVIGSASGSNITGDDNANVIQATGGVNVFSGLGGDDMLIGASGYDNLTGGTGNDRLYGQTGEDSLTGGAGDDYLDGGEGTDRVNYNDNLATAGVVVDLAAGTASSSYFGNDILVGIESVKGSHLADTIYGDAAANRLIGLAGNDQLFGRDGNDELYGDDGADLINGGEGSDTAYYGVGNANLTSGTAQGSDGLIDTLVSIENLVGSIGDNNFTGNNDANVLDGGQGNDTLNGRRGNDTLIGGYDQDIFVFDQNGFANDQDVVQDFEVGIDRLDFSASGIDDLGEFQDAATQIGANVVIDTGNGTITLLNVQLSAMSVGDFIF
jgi:Ca2+-binding RTX toxin-like protein